MLFCGDLEKVDKLSKIFPKNGKHGTFTVDMGPFSVVFLFSFFRFNGFIVVTF